MCNLIMETNDEGFVTWKNSKGDIVCDWNDDANIDYPEDLVSYRDIGDLVNKVYEAGILDGKTDLILENQMLRKSIASKEQMYEDLLNDHIALSKRYNR